MKRQRHLSRVILIAGSLLCSRFAVYAEAPPFYDHKTIQLVVSFGPGGGYDLWARTLARHMSKYIPGNPSIVVQDMPGAGGFIATNYIYNQAPRDGTSFGLVAREAILGPLTNAAGARFTPTKMGWIGSPTIETSVCIVNSSAGIKSVADLQSNPVSMGDTGSGSGTYAYPRVLAQLLGLKFKFVTGFPSTADVFLAMQRGEVDGVCEGADSIRSRQPTWIPQKKVVVLFESGRSPRPDLPGVPSVYSLAKTDEQKQAIAFLYAGQNMGRPFVAPPDLLVERLATLRQAFMKTMADPDFIADAKTQKLPVDPIGGAQLEQTIRDVFVTSQPIIAMVGKIMH
jgi:tripartite-type tricarboxylate transporter receptor subunit TctC